MQIQKLQLYTHRLAGQRQFYTQTLGLPLREDSPTAFAVQAGSTRLRFEEVERQHYYHFAFNIPPFQYEEALEWLRARVPLLRDGDTELIDFSNWNAYAMYFEDPGGNILEFIARRDIDAPSPSTFGPDRLLSISEIGLSVASVEAAFAKINAAAAVPFYSGNRENFCAAGDPEGLFIIVDHNNKEWYPTGRPARFFPLTVQFSENGQPYQLQLTANGPQLHRLTPPA